MFYTILTYPKVGSGCYWSTSCCCAVISLIHPLTYFHPLSPSLLPPLSLSSPQDEYSKKEVSSGELSMRVRFLPAGKH